MVGGYTCRRNKSANVSTWSFAQVTKPVVNSARSIPGREPTRRHSVFLERGHVPITRMPYDCEANDRQFGNVDTDIPFGLDGSYAFEHDISPSCQEHIPRKLGAVESDKERNQTASTRLAKLESGQIVRDLLDEVGSQLVQPYCQQRFGRRIGRHGFQQILTCNVSLSFASPRTPFNKLQRLIPVSHGDRHC